MRLQDVLQKCLEDVFKTFSRLIRDVFKTSSRCTQHVFETQCEDERQKDQLVIFKPLSYCFEETIGLDVKASFVSRPVSHLIRWYNKRILRKGYSVPRDFSWIENYKLRCISFILMYNLLGFERLKFLKIAY